MYKYILCFCVKRYAWYDDCLQNKVVLCIFTKHVVKVHNTTFFKIHGDQPIFKKVSLKHKTCQTDKYTIFRSSEIYMKPLLK